MDINNISTDPKSSDQDLSVEFLGVNYLPINHKKPQTDAMQSYDVGTTMCLAPHKVETPNTEQDSSVSVPITIIINKQGNECSDVCNSIGNGLCLAYKLQKL